MTEIYDTVQREWVKGQYDAVSDAYYNRRDERFAAKGPIDDSGKR